MKSEFKLYWVRTPAAEEDTFVVARSRRKAAKFEERSTGFDPNDCIAEFVAKPDLEWVTTAYADRNRSIPLDTVDAFYIGHDDLLRIGIEIAIVEGDEVFRFRDIEYVKQGVMNYLSSLGDKQETVLIRSVSDLLEIVDRSAKGDWIFRGHSSSSWALQSSVQRLLKARNVPVDQTTAFERRLLGEFIRRARIFLPNPPNSDWEWLVVAQHFGLPTRLLDWTENPLIALYFAVRSNTEMSDDGVLYAYKHKSLEVDIRSKSDPFAISKIQLIRPPHLDQRVIVQRSVFTVEPSSGGEEVNQSAGLNYWYVSCLLADRIREELGKLGISESTIFPGLDALATEIRDEALFWDFDTIAKECESGDTDTKS